MKELSAPPEGGRVGSAAEAPAPAAEVDEAAKWKRIADDVFNAYVQRDRHAKIANALAAEVERLTKERDRIGQMNVTLLRNRDEVCAYAAASDARADAAEAEVAELKKLLAPEVLAAAQLIALNADAHPAGCCHECSAGLAQRDALLKALREIVAAIDALKDEFALRLQSIAAAAIKEASHE